MDSHTNQNLLVLAERSRSTLSFCDSKAPTHTSAMKSWLNEQPSTDLKKLGTQLIIALDELLLLNCPPSDFYELIEILRTPVITTTEGLHQRHLNRSITFDAGQQECFDICSSLHQMLSKAYIAAFQHSFENEKLEHKKLQDKKQLSLSSKALHRALAHISLAILFNYQFYRPAAKGLWLALHYLFQQTNKLKQAEYSQSDVHSSNNKKLTTADLYKRALLLSHSRTNKLTAQEIKQTWNALAIWSPHSKIKPVSGLHTYFAANLKADEGLHYASPDPDKPVKGIIGLDTRILAAYLLKLQSTPEKQSTKQGALSSQLISHLASAWAQISKRQNQRIKEDSSCLICPGFSAAHYQLSQQQYFRDITAPYTESSEMKKSTFKPEDKDVWSDAQDAKQKQENSDTKSDTDDIIQFGSQVNALDGNQFEAVECSIINQSLNGYCAEINTPCSYKMHVGDPVALKGKDETNWSLAAIRWIEVNHTNNLRIGLEILSTQATPCAIAHIHKTQGMSHFQRAFQLPDSDIAAAEQHSTLIMPGLAAKPGMKFKLIHNDVLKKGQLTKCISNTAGYSEYQYILFG